MKYLGYAMSLFVFISCGKKEGYSGSAKDSYKSTYPSYSQDEIVEAEAEASANASRASELHAAVIKSLNSRHKESKDSLWSDSQADFSENWLMQTPENYWDRPAEELPKELSCAATTCDSLFQRRLCSSDADCKDSQSTCQTLEASVALPTQKPKKMCLGSGDKLFDHFYTSILKAQNHVDITSLSMPTGRFRSMLVNALSVLSQRASPPTVRILMAGADLASLNVLQPAQFALNELMDDVQKRGGNPDKLRVNLAWLALGLSWNHSKIILADQEHMMEGGHNLYDPDYPGDEPVFDISMRMSGLVASHTQAYINKLWSNVGLLASGFHPFGSGSIQAPSKKPAKDGASKVIGVGRLGVFGKNPSDDGLLALIDASQRNIYLAVQDIHFNVPVLGDVKPTWILNSLVDAVLRGVTVRIVQSDHEEGTVAGYSMMNYDKSFKIILDAIEKEAVKRKFKAPDGQSLREYVCAHYEHAPWRFKEGVDRWANGSRIGAHAKLLIADESVFYMGSQNFYPANLQEYGVIVSDPRITQDLLRQHWNRLWGASQSSKAECS